MQTDEKKPPVGGESNTSELHRSGPSDQGVFRVAFESPTSGMFFPMYFRRFGPLKMDAESQRMTFSFSGQIDQFSTPSPEGGSTPQSLMPEHVLSTGTRGMVEWTDGLNVTVNVTISRETGQWKVEDCWVTDDPCAANEVGSNFVQDDLRAVN
ncbi:hypothetical protein [Limnohabitans lacus]|uniref:Uncharacterized protein n=1 Tax=Limnohabitans lacus TaxID=3045173 RepID=A0ABT6X895_9BURK|nr:hypothetical protein [Limnohabitans sp. HM2-2]MDI9234341.1 hypothetical protein [Limnohabitans sp. HM2-2]